ncbi:phospholipase D family protein, partial [Pseudomonas protegens]
MASPPNPPGPNGPSPLHFIENGPWKEALFTTYALSLTYFESYVLPRLRKAGCEKVTLLVDIQGYRASMMELRARHVGKDYALIPVRVKDGIFHPKITYLRGEDQDLLMVGSGNLTFGGHGGNVEVLEVLSAGEQPGAFADFADFLENLCTRPHLQIADDSALLPFIQRARALSQQFHDQAPPQPVELL